MRWRLAAAALLALLLSSVPSPAQTPVTIVGPITVGNCVQFFSPVQIKDAGVVCGGAAGAVQSVGNFASDTSLTIAGVGTGPWNGAVTVKVNLANPQTWSGAQSFSGGITASSITDTALASAGTQCVQANTSGVLSGTGSACGSGGGGAVSSVSNADGTLTIAPTTGAVVSSLNLAHANTWTALQKHILAGDGLLISNNAAATALTNQGIDIAQDGAPGSVTITTYGIVGTTNMPTFVGQTARGSLASPAVVQANDVLASFSGRGYIGSGFAAAGRGFVRILASETWSTTGNGTYVSFVTTPNATTAPAEALRIENSGGMTVPATVTGGDKGAGSINVGSLFIAGAPLTLPISLATLANQAANTVVGNATGVSASPTAMAMPSCSTAASALIWTTNTGFGCNTNITAAAVPASGLTGTTLASNVVASSLTSVGTLTGGSTGAGFTINFAASTESGLLGLANGGTNAALTASNGGIVYSTASALAVLAGTVTSGQCLLSGSNAAPSWGSCSGGAAVSSVSNADGTLTISPTTGAVVASIALGHANTWTGAQTHINSGILLLGSSTGATTFTSANAGASNFTLTFPAATDQLVARATTDTLTNKTYDTAGTGNVFKINGTTITAISGNTGTVGTTSGAFVSGNCVKTDVNHNLVDNGAVCGGGGGGTPGGANTNVQFNSSGTFGGDSGLTYAGAGGVFTLTPAANTAQPMLITGGSTTVAGTSKLGLSVVGTLNTSGVVDGAILFANILNTASGTGTFFVDLQIGSTSIFTIDKNGNVGVPVNVGPTFFGNTNGAGGPAYSGIAMVANGTSVLIYQAGIKSVFITSTVTSVPAAAVIGWSSTTAADGAVDTKLTRGGAAGLLALSDSAVATQFNVYNTVDNPSGPTNFERGIFGWQKNTNILTIGTDNGGTGTARNMILAPAALFAAAGTALPACTAGTKGYQAVVSDATTPTYNATYTSGGAVVAHVVCSGSNWTTQ